MNRKYSLRALHSKKTMAPPFKIPKKKQSAGSDSAHLHMQSPLSRLQSPAPQLKSYGDQSSRGGADRMHAGSALGSSTDGQRVPCKPLLRDVVKTLLALNSPNKGPSTANHSSAGGWSHQSQAGQRAEVTSACLTNRNKIGADQNCGSFLRSFSLSAALRRWRPKRASDRLLQPALTSEPSSPPQKKKSDLRASFLSNKRVSVNTLDSLAELRGDKHAGSLSSSTLGRRTWSRVEPKGGAAERKSDGGNSSISISDQTSDDDFLSPSKDKEKSLLKVSCTPSVSTATLSKRMTPDRRRSVGRTAWLSSSLREDPREAERQRWAEFREKKKTNRLAVLRRQARKPRQTPTEPIVLSSEEEEGEEEEEDGGRSSRGEESHPGSCEQKQAQQACSSKGETDGSSPPPSSMQLEFTSLHAGLTHADANGRMMISENEIRIPLKGVKEEEVSVVATQVRGYGVWDGGMAQGGDLLASWKGPAPSLLFLWVTDAQANLLQKELFAIQTPGAAAAAGPSCCFLLLVLKEQLQELQAALLASILDMEEYRKASSSSSGLTSPLEWTDGLLLLHSCPPPLDQHLLGLLGCAAESCGQVRRSQRRCSLNSPGLQQLPTRLIQYPAAPSKGRITVTKEDLACLDSGEFLNDVIIDFYLRFLLLEGVGGSVAERSHVFSSFFYKQLSRRRVAGEDETPSVPDRHTRHQRVKTWTRHVDIFTKDFLFVPVNQEAHWFLVVVCFPALEEVQYEDFQRPTGGSERAAGVTSQQAPDCTLQGCQRSSVWKRPCILVMDSLKLSYHENVCRLLRDYLQVEWQVRRGTPRLFTLDNMRSSNCRVPQQDNSSDCGVYLLQYAESFLQNPVVHFNIPLHLDHWFPRQRVRRKREEIRSLIMKMHQRQRDETS